MGIRRVVPNITCAHVEESRDFYVALFDLEVAMDLGWIVTLSSPDNPTAQISLLRGEVPGKVRLLGPAAPAAAPPRLPDPPFDQCDDRERSEALCSEAS